MTDWTNIISLIGVAVATHFLPKLAEAWNSRGTAKLQADQASATQRDATALSRDQMRDDRISRLEGRVDSLNTQLLDSERVRAGQAAQLTDVCAERDTWKGQFHDLAVAVKEELNEARDLAARIWMRFQAAQIARSAPPATTQVLPTLPPTGEKGTP